MRRGKRCCGVVTQAVSKHSSTRGERMRLSLGMVVQGVDCCRVSISEAHCTMFSSGGVNFSSSKSLENCLPLAQCPLVIAPYAGCAQLDISEYHLAAIPICHVLLSARKCVTLISRSAAFRQPSPWVVLHHARRGNFECTRTG